MEQQKILPEETKKEQPKRLKESQGERGTPPLRERKGFSVSITRAVFLLEFHDLDTYGRFWEVQQQRYFM